MTFHLVHRSQRDPLAADEKAPQHVLLPAAKVRRFAGLYPQAFHTVTHPADDNGVHSPHKLVWIMNLDIRVSWQADAEKRREEQRKVGVFFDDDYDYLQHLKEASGQTELLATRPSPPRLCADDDDGDGDGEHDADQKERSLPVSSSTVTASMISCHLNLFIGSVDVEDILDETRGEPRCRN